MLEINLLPKELRRRRRDTGEAAKLMFFKALSVFIIVILVLVHGLMLFYQQGLRSDLEIIEEEYRALGSQREEVAAIADDIEELQTKVQAIRDIAGPEVQWADLLTGLNKAMIPNVWLSFIGNGESRTSGRVAQERADGRSISIRGYALGESEHATSLVAKFITSLQRENDFARFFKNIELDSMQSQRIEGDEVMMFVLKCDFE